MGADGAPHLTDAEWEAYVAGLNARHRAADIVRRRIPDFHATIHCALGINPNKVLFAGSRPVPITDHGKPVGEIFG